MVIATYIGHDKRVEGTSRWFYILRSIFTLILQVVEIDAVKLEFMATDWLSMM